MSTYACEEYSHPERDMKLILVVERDGKTPEIRRALAAETMAVANDEMLKCVPVERTWEQIEELEEYSP